MAIRSRNYICSNLCLLYGIWRPTIYKPDFYEDMIYKLSETDLMKLDFMMEQSFDKALAVLDTILKSDVIDKQKGKNK